MNSYSALTQQTLQYNRAAILAACRANDIDRLEVHVRNTQRKLKPFLVVQPESKRKQLQRIKVKVHIAVPYRTTTGAGYTIKTYTMNLHSAVQEVTHLMLQRQPSNTPAQDSKLVFDAQSNLCHLLSSTRYHDGQDHLNQAAFA